MVVVARDPEDVEAAGRREEVRRVGDVQGKYIEMVGKDEGWASVPPTRKSTYARPEYKQAAPFSDFVLQAIESANPNDATLHKVPYTGVRFVGILEFQSFGTVVGQSISGVVAGQTSVDNALKAANAAADRAVKQAGYQK